MQHPDEGTIHAWIDGELPAGEASALEAHAVECAQCSATIAEARGLVAASSRIVSALDIVPGGVIPVAISPKRSWYMTTQLRAAAAVLFVAGASLVVIRGGEKSRAELTQGEGVADSRKAIAGMSAPDEATGADVNTAETGAYDASAADAGAADARVKSAVPPVSVSPLGSQASVSPSRRKTTDASSTTRAAAREPSPVPSALSIDAASAEPSLTGARESQRRVPAVVPVPQMQKVTANAAEAQRDSALRSRFLRSDSLKLNQVVVTGVASGVVIANQAAGPTELRRIHADTIGNITRTRYESSPGVQVTLTETAPRGFSVGKAAAKERAAGPRSLSAAVAAAVPAPAPAASRDTAPPVSFITWTDATTGRIYVLEGPLSREKLEEIRRRLPQPQR